MNSPDMLGDQPPTPEEEAARIAESYKFDDDGFTRFEDISEGELGQLGQYTSQYVDGFEGKPVLSEGLLFQGDPVNFSTLKIHRNSILPFVQRIRDYREEQIRKALGE